MIIKRYNKVTSTNEIAKKIKPPPWTVILAKEQTSGYGKEKRFWFSPEGGLYFTVVLPKLEIEDLNFLTILIAYSVAKVIKEKLNLEPFIKLPNDIYLNQKKVAGILIENVIGKKVLFSIAGIGINTNIDKFPENLQNIATSIKIETKRKVKNFELLKALLFEIKGQIEKMK